MTPSSKKGHVAWSDGDGGDVVAPRSTPNENDEVPQRMRSRIPGRGIVTYPYRVCFTITRPQADTANKQDATRSTHIALTVDQIPYIAPFDTSS